MKRLIALLLAFSLLSCPVFADAEDETECEHFRVWSEWNDALSTETLDSEQHRITAACPDCGETVFVDEFHDYTMSDAEAYDGEQHRTMKTCAACGYGVYIYANHEWQYGNWQTEDNELYFRVGICAVCGMENPVLDFYEVEQSEDGETDSPEETSDPMPEETPEPETEVPKETPQAFWTAMPSETAEPSALISESVEPDAAYPVAVISVTVPDNLPLTATGGGDVYAIDNLSIVNHSDRAVRISAVTVEAAGGWTLSPYTGTAASGGAAQKSIGFYVNGAATAGIGKSESLYLPGDWTIAKGAALPLRYDATVSFADIPHEGEQVLTLTFILDWA